MKKNDTIKAWGYCRYSSHNQREESILGQKRAINEWAKKQNVEVTRWYVDEAKSARTDDREQFLKLIEDSGEKEHKEVTMVVVHKLDRFSRDKYDSAIYKHKLGMNGKKLYSVTEQFGDTPESRLLESVVEGMNQFYSENLSREALKGLKENAYSNRTTGSTAPLGLRVNKETLCFEIDEPNAEAIRILFHRFVYDRKSYPVICEELNAKGFRSTRGNKFSSKGGLIDMLNNEKYVGRLTYLKSKKNPITGKRTCKRDYDRDSIIISENAIPAIIDEETFNKAQELLAQRRRNASSYQKTRKINLFVGKVFCQCRCLMNMNTRKSGKSKEYYSTYRCTAKNEKMGLKCDSREISAVHLERYVISQLMFYLKQDETIDRITSLLNEVLVENNRSQELDTANIKQQILNLDVKIQNLMNALAEASVPVNAVLEKIQMFEDDKKSLENQLNGISTTSSNLMKIEKEEVCVLLEQANEYMLSENDEQIRAVIELFVEKIIVGENCVEIMYYLHPFSYIKNCLWQTSVTRDELMNYKGFSPKLMKGRWSRKSIISLSESKPSLNKVIMLVG